MVGHPAPFWRPGRLHGARPLLLLSGGSPRLRCAQSGNFGCAWRLRRRIYVHRSCARHAGSTAKMASANRAAYGHLGIAAASHIAALPLVALLGLAAMLWVAEGRRSQTLPVVLVAVAGALVLLFVCYGFSPDAFSYVFRSSAGFLWISIDPARRFFCALGNAGITVASGAALVLYLGLRRFALFGNTAPLLCALALMVVLMTGYLAPLALGPPVSAYIHWWSFRRCV